MPRFVLLYTEGPRTSEERDATFQQWVAWVDSLGETVIEPGDPFTTKAQAVIPGRKASEGPMQELEMGYSLIQADSLDEAIAIANTCPPTVGKIRVHEFLSVK